MSDANANASAPTGQEAEPNANASAPVEGDGGILSDVSDEGDEQAPGDKGEPGQSDQEGELQITLPDGAEINEDLMGQFKQIASEIGLNSETASKLADWYVGQQTKEVEALQNQGKAWMTELSGDPDFGGKNLEATVSQAKKALIRFGGEEVARGLAEMGLGNYPPLVKAFARVGRAIAEDNSGPGGAPPPAPNDAEAEKRARYPTMYNEDGSPKY